MTDDGKKRCRDCGETKPVDQFRSTTNSSGTYPRSNCRACENVDRGSDRLRRQNTRDDPYGDLRAIFGIEREAWMEQAACKGLGWKQFFPSQGVQPGHIARIVEQTCAVCPVRDDCFAYSMKTNAHYGVWGGLSESDRKRLRRERTA